MAVLAAGPAAQKAGAEHHDWDGCPATHQAARVQDCYQALRVEALPVPVLADCQEFRDAELLPAVCYLWAHLAVVPPSRGPEMCCPERLVEAPQVWRCCFQLPAFQAQVC